MTSEASQRPDSQGESEQSRADLLIGLLCFGVFAIAFVATIGWPIQASRFPRFITGVGAACSALYILKYLLVVSRKNKTRQVRSGDEGPLSESLGTNTDTGQEESVQGEEPGYVFASAGSRAWFASLAWISSFFLLTYVVGVFLAGALFALVYLKFGGNKSWAFSVCYALLLAVGLWFLFDEFLNLPLPSGLINIL